MIHPPAVAALWLIGVLGGLMTSARAYVLSGRHWPSDQPIIMYLNLGNPRQTLIDGSTTWNQVAEAAIAVWNPYLGSGVQLVGNETAISHVQGDRQNSVFFNDTIYGDDFGDDTLAVTLSFVRSGTNIRTEADVIFNSAVAFDSYRGDLRRTGSASVLYDLRRVAIHEFGHVLGLEHTSQSAKAIMAPAITNIDTIQGDDIAGVRAIYDYLDSPPSITSTLTASATVGKTFSYYIQAKFGPTGYGASGLPAGLGVDPATGTITGAPTVEGTFNVVLTATNDKGTGTATLILTTAIPPAITSALQATAIVGKPFFYRITASHHPTSFDTYVYNGLVLDTATGIISGTPTQASSYDLTISAKNVGGTGSATLRLSVVLDTALITIHTFNGSDGSTPDSALLLAADGNFYGTTNSGGANNQGTIFKMTPDGIVTTLHSFSGTDTSGDPAPPLIQAADGNFYGTTKTGGDHQQGSVFKMAPDGTFTTLHSFALPDGSFPVTALVQGPDGAFYGSTPFDTQTTTNNSGMIFRITADGAFTVIHDLSDAGGGCSALIAASDGNLYGTLRYGGTGYNGAIVRITPAGTLTTLYSFNYFGDSPSCALVPGLDGCLYGSAGDAVASGSIVFRTTLDGTFTTVHTFTYGEGAGPSALVAGKDGNFYGTTATGAVVSGSDVSATLFKVTPGGVLTTLHSFTHYEGPSALAQGNDGEFYGVTKTGGVGGHGTVFKTTLNSPAAILPVVSVAATTPDASAASGEAGVFTVSLSAAQMMDVVVSYTVKGSAANGTDYAFLKGTVKIKAGKTSKTLKIVPLGDLRGLGKRVVKMSLIPTDIYTVDASAPVKVKILAQ